MIRKSLAYAIALTCLCFVHANSQSFDCNTAIPICVDTTLSFMSNGSGADDFAQSNNDPGCLLFGEHQSLWMVIHISPMSPPDASLGFTLSPDDNDTDFDFALYGPSANCDNLGSPIRCSYANLDTNNCLICPLTGLGMGESDIVEDATGNGFLSMVTVQPGDVFYLLIDNYDANTTQFELTWTGDAILDCNDDCLVNAGTFQVTGPGNNQSEQFPVTDSDPPHYVLCPGDRISFLSDDNYLLPPGIPGEDSTLLWAVYAEPPPDYPSPGDQGFSGKLIDEDYIDEINSNGENSFLPNGLTITNNRIWLLPVTGDDGTTSNNPNQTTAIDGNDDECFHYGDPISITYLNEITVDITHTCAGPEITIQGGYPEFFGGSYEISGLAPLGASASNYLPGHQERVLLEGIDHGELFSFTLEDGNGCSIIVDGVFDYDGSVIDIEVPDTLISCPDGSIELTVDVPAVPSDSVEVEWSGPGGFSSTDLQPFIDQPQEGFYVVNAWINGCLSNPGFTYVNILPAPVLDPIDGQQTCNSSLDLSDIPLAGSNLGFADISFYADDNGQPGISIDPVVTQNGTYWIVAGLNSSCQSAQPVEVHLGPEANLSIVSDVSCPGKADGYIITNVAFGEPPYQYNWSGTTANTGSAFDLSAGTYSVTITDANNCTALLQATIKASDPMSIDFNEINPIICFDDNQGTIEALASGGQPPYQFLWSTGASSAQISNLQTKETYRVTITDANGCLQTDSITLQAQSPPLQVQANITDAACDQNNGMIELVLGGGTAPYGINWSHDPGLTGLSATQLNPGLYQCTIIDDMGCDTVVQFPVSELNAPQIEVQEIVSAVCGQNNGSILISTSPPVDITWSHDPALSGYQAGGLPPGDYHVEATASNGCTSVIQITVPEEPGPEISLDQFTASNCRESRNGEAGVSVEGGTGPYTYIWSQNDSISGSYATNLPVGFQTVTVIDSNGCYDEFQFYIPPSNRQNVYITQVIPAACNQQNGSILLGIRDFTPPVTFYWDHDDNLTGNYAGNLPAGTYHVEVEDALGCKDDIWVDIIHIDGPIIDSIMVTPNSGCTEDDGVLEAVVSGGSPPYEFSWSHNGQLDDPLANQLAAGTYTVTVTDKRGCWNKASESVFYPNPDPPVVDTIITSPSPCGLSIGEIDIDVSGGSEPYTYTWTGNISQSDSASGLSPGWYHFTVTDSEGCMVVDSALVMASDAVPVFYVQQVVDAHCGQPDGEIHLIVPGQYGITWPGYPQWQGQSDLTGLYPGTYFVLVSLGDCVSPGEITVGNIPGPELLLDTLIDSHCGQASLVELGVNHVNSALDFSWSHDPGLSGPTADNIPVGSHSVTVTDEFGCWDSLHFQIQGTSTPFAQVYTVVDSECGHASGSASILASGGSGDYTFYWSHNPFLTGPEANYLLEGNYSVTVEDSEGCFEIVSFSIEGSSPPALQLDQVIDATCGENNGQINLSANGGQPPYSFSWSHNPNLGFEDLQSLASGVYSVTLTDANGCQDSLQIAVDDAGGPQIQIQEIHMDTCEQETGFVRLEVNGPNPPFTFNWSGYPGNNTTILSNVLAGSYPVTVTDALGCKTIEIIDIPGTKPPVIFPLEILPPDCNNNGGSISITLFDTLQPIDIQWSNGTKNTTFLEDLSTGFYSVTVTNANGCSQNADYQVYGNGLLNLRINELTPDDCRGIGGAISVMPVGGSGPYEYKWSHDPTLDGPTAENLPGGADLNYHVVVTDQNGCTDSLTFLIPEFGPPGVYIDSLSDEQCGGGNGSIQLAVSPRAIYRINCGETQTVEQDQYGNLYSPDIYFENGIITDTVIALGNVTNDRLFSKNRSSTGSFAYKIPIENGTYTVRFAFSNTRDKAYYQNNPVEINAFMENQQILNRFNPVDAFGAKMTGWQSFTTTVTDRTLDFRLFSQMGRVTLSAIEILPQTPLNISYQWSHNSQLSMPVASNLTTGQYTVTATDENGCETTLDIAIDDSSLPLHFPYQTSMDSCGTGTGTIAFDIEQGANYRINCGGFTVKTPDERIFQSDPGGQNAIQNQIDFGNTNQDILYHTMSSGNPQYALSLPNGKYQINLFFAERHTLNTDHYFHILLEGEAVEKDFHIASAAGGIQQAVIRTFIAQVNDGVLEIELLATQGNAEIAAIEVFPTRLSSSQYNISWAHDPGLTDTSISNLTAGDYTAFITDDNGCSYEEVFSVSPSPSVDILLSELTTTACSRADGIIGFEPTTANLTRNGQFTQGSAGFESDYNGVASNIQAGQFAIVTNGSDANNNFDPCEAQAPGDPYFMAVNGHTQPAAVWCQQIDVDPGVNYEFSFFASSLRPDNPARLVVLINGIPLGDTLQLPTNTCQWLPYLAEWTAADEVAEICIFNVNQAGPGNVFGLDDISLLPLTAISYQWSHTDTLQTGLATGLDAGTYYVTATDDWGCMAIDSATVATSEEPVVSLYKIKTPGCNLFDGEVHLQGEPVTRINAGAGSYLSTSTGNLFAADFAFQNGIPVTEPDFIDGTDDVALYQSYRLGQFSYELAVPDTGTYDLVLHFQEPEQANRIMDIYINGSLAEDDFSVFNQGGFRNALQKTYTIQVDSLLTVDFVGIGGNALLCGLELYKSLPVDYSYTWSFSGQLSEKDAYGLPEGDHHVLVTDSRGCSKRLSFSLGRPDDPLVHLLSLTPPAVCLGRLGSAIVEAEGYGDIHYEWSHLPSLDSPEAFDLAAGQYEVIITDGNNCRDTLPLDIEDSSVPDLIVDSIGLPDCRFDDGFIAVHAEGGGGAYRYSWVHADTLKDPIATNLGSGTYSVLVTDKNGCTSREEVTLDILGPEIQLESLTGAECEDGIGQIEISFHGYVEDPVEINWSHDTTLNDLTATGLDGGQYSVWITDNRGCSDTLTATVPNTDGPQVLAMNIRDPDSCGVATGQIELITDQPVDSLDILWSHDPMLSGLSASNLAPGDYSVTITDANGCTNISQATIKKPPALDVLLSQLNVATCDSLNGMASLLVSGATNPLQFAWSHDATLDDNLATNLAPGVYEVTISDARLCSEILSFEIDDIPPPVIVRDSLNQPYCALENGNILLEVDTETDSLTYEWSHDPFLSGPVADSLGSGSFSVSITDEYDCVITSDYQLVAETDTIYSVENLDMCRGELYNNIVITHDTTMQYWSNNVMGCDSMHESRITVWDADTSHIVNYSCRYEETGIFTTMETNKYGCDSMVIEEILPEMGDTTILLSETCVPQEAGYSMDTLRGKDGCDSLVIRDISLLPSDTLLLTSFTCFPDMSGTHLVGHFTNRYGCDSTVYEEVLPLPYDDEMGTLEITTTLGDSLQLNIDPGFTPAAVQWTPSVYLNCDTCLNPMALPLLNTLYEVTLIDENGCVVTGRVFVEVERDGIVYAPNVFSPNGDDVNDRFTLYAGDGVSRIELLRIYNRWGDPLFKANDFPPNEPLYGWDGTFHDKPMNPDVFVWYAIVRLIDGRTRLIKGDLTIVR